MLPSFVSTQNHWRYNIVAIMVISIPNWHEHGKMQLYTGNNPLKHGFSLIYSILFHIIAIVCVLQIRAGCFFFFALCIQYYYFDCVVSFPCQLHRLTCKMPANNNNNNKKNKQTIFVLKFALHIQTTNDCQFWNSLKVFRSRRFVPKCE